MTHTPGPRAKMVPKIILEGTRLTQKTDIAFALNSHPRIVGPRKYQYHSPLISAEWCGFTPTPWGRGLINFEADEAERAMETYATWARLFELMPHYSWIIDRFHLSTQLHQQMHHQQHYDFDWLEARMRPLGFAVVFCTRRPESFAAAREARLKISGNPSQYDDLDIFVREQALMRPLVAQSTLPVLEVDISDRTIDEVADTIADWMEETGLLWGEVQS
ncbi:MAG: hypothetical protein ACE366_15035 [Bradymonadia bacterium]